jgi:predicted Zn-ribbon and HTH transcriptional regulator
MLQCKGKCNIIKIQRFIGKKAAELLYNGFVGCTTCEIVFHKEHIINGNKCPCCKTAVRFKTREKNNSRNPVENKLQYPQLLQIVSKEVT